MASGALRAWLLALLALLLFSAPLLARAEDDADAGDAGAGSDAGVDVGDEAEGADEGDAEVEEEEDEDEDVDKVSSHPDIATSFYFPENPERKLKIGELTYVIVGVHNRGSNTFNLTGVGASLHSPKDYSYTIQPMQPRGVQPVPLGPQMQATLEYSFYTDPNLDPLDLVFTGYVGYNNSRNRAFVTLFFNETVSLVEVPKPLDLQSVLQLGVIAAVLGVAAWALVTQVILKRMRKGRRAPRSVPKSSPTAAASADPPVVAYKQKPLRRSVSGGSNKSD
jgi:hypothetical protein